MLTRTNSCILVLIYRELKAFSRAHDPVVTAGASNTFFSKQRFEGLIKAVGGDLKQCTRGVFVRFHYFTFSRVTSGYCGIPTPLPKAPNICRKSNHT